MFKLSSLSLVFLIWGALQLCAAECKIVAAENFYASVAQQIAGPEGEVVSIMNNPNQDPHEFQSDPKTARAVADADIVIYNGLGYDTWMEKLLSVHGKPNRVVINVAALTEAPQGGNPHLWYDPHTMQALAKNLASLLHKPASEAAFLISLQPLFEKMEALKAKTKGMKVTATEPTFGLMASALGFQMLNEGYQRAIMNDGTPNFEQMAGFQKSLISHTAKILFQNTQTMNPATQRMVLLAEKEGIPIVSVTETQPSCAKTYVDWMLLELEKVEAVLKSF